MNTIVIHNVETGEIVEREMNAEELAQHKKDKATFESSQTAEQEKEIARQALLDKLGITADEAKLLLS
jgi:hypothetical protein